MKHEHEILINSSEITHNYFGDSYEFVLNEILQVSECVRIDSMADEMVHSIKNPGEILEGKLFELNHVRVNPRVDNTHIISCLTKALNDIGVYVANPPSSESMDICFKPLGEISDNVRFFLDLKGNMVFLSPSTKPKLVSINNQLRDQQYF